MIILLCRWDYLKITNEKKESLGVYCGERTGEKISVRGGRAVLTFFSGSFYGAKGFRLSFTSVPPRKNK